MSNPNPTPALGNLIPFKRGYDPNRNNEGRPAGVKNWATIVQDLLGDPNLVKELTTGKYPAWVDTLKHHRAAEAIVSVMVIHALKGNVKAADWLRKTGYGDRLDLTTKGRPIRPLQLYDPANPEVEEPEEDTDENRPETEGDSGQSME